MNKTLSALDYGVIGIYLVVLLFVGFWSTRSKGKTADLFLGGRSLTWPMIGFSIFATNVNPMMLVGFCGIAYSTGVVVSNFEWLAWPFLLLLAMVFVPHYLNTKVSTMPQFLERRFGRRCHTFLSYYSLLSILFLWIGAALYAGGKIVATFTGINFFWAVIVIAIIATSYTAAGGLKAVVRTDVFQSVLIIGASIVLTVIAFNRIGSFEQLKNAVPAERWHLFRGAESDYPWYALILGYPVIGVYYWCTDQTIVQRVLGAKNYREGQYGVAFTAVLKIIMPFIFIFPGIMCFVLFPGLKDGDEAYMTLISRLLPAGLVGLVVAALIASLINTIASALNSFSTLFTLDVYHRSINPSASAEKLKSVGRFFTLLPAVIGVLVTVVYYAAGKNLFDLIQGLASYLAPPLTTVFLAGVLWHRATPRAAEVTLIGGGFLCLLLGALYVLKLPSADYWPPFMLFTFYLFLFLMLVMVVVSLLTKPQADKVLPTLKETYRQAGEKISGSVWRLWFFIMAAMITIYIIFN